jgi:hypothetical protein
MKIMKNRNNIKEERNLRRINYFEELDDIKFKMRFRLNKQSVLLILEEIREELAFFTNGKLKLLYN